MELTRTGPAEPKRSSGGDDWDGFVDGSPQGTLFCRSWWLDAVCPDGYELLAVRRGGRILAGMPLPFWRRGTSRCVRMPHLTQILGVLLAPPRSAKYESNLSDEMDALTELVRTIPDLEEFTVHCNYRFTNWLPFSWAGYSQTIRYTYLLSDLTNPDAIYRGMSESDAPQDPQGGEGRDRRGGVGRHRGVPAAAGDDLHPTRDGTAVRPGTGAADRPGLRGARARKMFAARDGEGKTHVILYVVYDRRSMYYLTLGSDPALRSSGASFLAHWHAIRFAACVTAAYDFAGTMMANVEPVFRSFGAVQTPYFKLFKPPTTTSLREVCRVVRQFVRDKWRAVWPPGLNRREASRGRQALENDGRLPPGTNVPGPPDASGPAEG